MSVIVTCNEVEVARKNPSRYVMWILSDVRLTADGCVDGASGTFRQFPWAPDDGTDFRRSPTTSSSTSRRRSVRSPSMSRLERPSTSGPGRAEPSPEGSPASGLAAMTLNWRVSTAPVTAAAPPATRRMARNTRGGRPRVAAVASAPQVATKPAPIPCFRSYCTRKPTCRGNEEEPEPPRTEWSQGRGNRLPGA